VILTNEKILNLTLVENQWNNSKFEISLLMANEIILNLILVENLTNEIA
jgi:hypothetical protein